MYRHFFKRFLDIVLSLTAILILSPLRTMKSMPSHARAMVERTASSSLQPSMGSLQGHLVAALLEALRILLREVTLALVAAELQTAVTLSRK